jgi:hypothetical protein
VKREVAQREGCWRYALRNIHRCTWYTFYMILHGIYMIHKGEYYIADTWKLHDKDKSKTRTRLFEDTGVRHESLLVHRDISTDRKNIFY